MFGCPLTAYHQRTLTPDGQLSVVETEAQSRSESERQRHCRNISLSQNLILSNGRSHPALDRPQIRRFAIVHGLVCFYFVFNITMPIKQRTSSTAGNNKHNPITSRCLKIRPGLKTVPKLVDINFMRLILPSGGRMGRFSCRFISVLAYWKRGLADIKAMRAVVKARTHRPRKPSRSPRRDRRRGPSDPDSLAPPARKPRC